MNPEAKAREKIDDALVAAGWAIQDYKAFHPSAARGIALREVPLASGRCDYLLLVDRIPLGVIEAKKEGITLSAAPINYSATNYRSSWLNQRDAGRLTRGPSRYQM
jgi:type I site-specific restriction endonuclease